MRILIILFLILPMYASATETSVNTGEVIDLSETNWGREVVYFDILTLNNKSVILIQGDSNNSAKINVNKLNVHGTAYIYVTQNKEYFPSNDFTTHPAKACESGKNGKNGMTGLPGPNTTPLEITFGGGDIDKLVILAPGQRGGEGENGGNGQDGGDPVDCSCDAGNGGNAGVGGDGGTGGKGARVVINYSGIFPSDIVQETDYKFPTWNRLVSNEFRDINFTIKLINGKKEPKNWQEKANQLKRHFFYIQEPIPFFNKDQRETLSEKLSTKINILNPGGISGPIGIDGKPGKGGSPWKCLGFIHKRGGANGTPGNRRAQSINPNVNPIKYGEDGELILNNLSQKQ